MSKHRRFRPLSPEERRLWGQVARSVKPLKGKAPPPEPEPEERPATKAPPEIVLPPSPAPGPQSRKPALPPLAPLERRTMKALRRGTRPVDGVIDLHGMRQDEAHFALLNFLYRAQGSGHGLVLVITGKGGPAGGGLFEERGILRRMVPHWLRLPELRSLVVGFEEASPQHGGSGALYVRLRRRRGAG